MVCVPTARWYHIVTVVSCFRVAMHLEHLLTSFMWVLTDFWQLERSMKRELYNFNDLFPLGLKGSFICKILALLLVEAMHLPSLSSMSMLQQTNGFKGEGIVSRYCSLDCLFNVSETYVLLGTFSYALRRRSSTVSFFGVMGQGTSCRGGLLSKFTPISLL